MTDETKKLFNAPWKVDEMFPKFVDDKDGFFLAETESERVTARFARLPELYDVLMEAAWEHCNDCDKPWIWSSPDDFIEHGCEGKEEFCPVVRWWEILKKVRDGE